MRQEMRERKSPKGGRHLLGALGRMDSSLAAPFLGGRAKVTPPLSLGPIYSGGKGGQPHLSPGASLSLPNTSSSSVELGEALTEYCSFTTTTPSCCCWSHLPQPLLPLAGSRRRRRHADRTCVEHGGAVRSALGSPVIWITSSMTSLSSFFERFRV